jgi:hypothetical protein
LCAVTEAPEVLVNIKEQNLGEESFLEELEAWLAKAANGRKRESHSGGARDAHDEAAGEKLTRRGAKVLGIASDELARMPRTAPEKVALAWWLRQRTTVSLRWVSERLGMGHYTRVTQAVSRMNRKPGRQLWRMREKLLASESDNQLKNGKVS